MSGTDDEKPGGDVVSFPRVFMPGSFDAPDPSETGPDDDSDQAPRIGSMPRLPGVASMAPPLALTMPGVPTPDESSDDDGALVLPTPADPDNPTAQEILATAMTLMTALGVAAAQGMWHRARHRSALADQSRAAADKSRAARRAVASHTEAQTKALKVPRGAGSSGGSSGLLRSLGGEKTPKGSRAFGHQSRRGGAHGKQSFGPHGGPKGGSKPKQPKKGSKGGAGSTHSSGTTGRQRAWKAVKGGAKGAKRWAGRNKPSSTKTPKQTPKQTPKATGKAAPAPKRPSSATTRKTWKAPKNGSTKGPKRWKTSTKPSSKATPGPKRPTTPRKTWKAPKNGTKGAKRWKTSTTKPSSKKQTPKQPKATPGQDQQKPPPPPPPPGWEGMRPPPAADRTTRITVERVDHQAQPTEVRALTEGPRALSAPAKTTQYADADLTIHDVIEADADMAVEILDGVVEARSSADGCEQLLTRLEAVHAKVLDLKVPGVLAGLLAMIVEKTFTVKAKAEAIAERLPAASEAISIAGTNAAARHKPLADAVRDAGHIRPAERDYHNE